MHLTEKDQANQLRWDGARRGFYEVYYLKWNDRATRTAAWIRYTLTSPATGIGERYCELWGIFFDGKNAANHLAVKNRFSIDHLSTTHAPFALTVAGAKLTSAAAQGAINDERGAATMRWEVEVTSADGPFRPFPFAFMYESDLFPKTKMVVPHENARFTGELVVGKRRIQLRDAPGQQTHLWGVKHAHRWAWGHCNAFAEDTGAVWEGLDATIRLGPFQPRFTFFLLKAFGRTHVLNQPTALLLSRSTWDSETWRFESGNHEIKVIGEIRARPEDIVTVTYMDPDGALLYCHNCKIADVRLQLQDRRGKALGTLTAERTCAVEFVDRVIHPGRKVYI
jgi:hypothetical protein